MLEHGAALRFPIYDANGILLLAQGVLINDRLRRLLEVRGISLAASDVSEAGGEGGQVGLEIPVNKPFINFGRRSDCDLQLYSQVVSGHHCKIIKAEFAVLQGISRSRERHVPERPQAWIDVTELKNGDLIRVGHFVFEVQIHAALAADSSEGETVLNAWILQDSQSTRKPASQYCRTEPDLDLSRQHRA